MKKLLAIGEALIDFIAEDKGYLVKDTAKFIPKVGGAPTNVCGAFSRLGGTSGIITMLGYDAFGDKIMDYLKENNISTEFLYRTTKANTSLAFVSRGLNGERDFTFYRNPGADMLLEPDAVKPNWFNRCYALHFCSVDIGKFPMRNAHLEAIKYAKEKKSIISFDPNLRPQLWPSKEELRISVLQFIPFANIIKISDDELEFLTGKKNIEDALEDLFIGSVEVVLYTRGSNGAMAFTKKEQASVDGIDGVNVIDTTGAGDAFIGSFLYQLYASGIHLKDLPNLSQEQLLKFLRFSNLYCAKSIQSKGAIASYPTLEEMEEEENEGI